MFEQMCGGVANVKAGRGEDAAERIVQESKVQMCAGRALQRKVNPVRLKGNVRQEVNGLVSIKD